MSRSKYQIGRPTQEVRLRNWPAGRVAQFKKAIELLEIQLNQTMATQVDQGDKRVLSPRVPKVTGLSVRSGFKNFQIHFLEAKGISNLLFYEIQKSNAANFNDVRTYQIPQTDLTIATATEREVVYFRVRCVTSNFEVGPWSSIVRGVGSSSFRLAITRTESDEVAVLIADKDVWTDIGSAIFEATTSNVCLHLHAGIHAISVAHFTTKAHGADVDHSVEASISIRILKNGVAMPGSMTMNANAESARNSNVFDRNEQVQVDTMVTPFEQFNGDEGTITYTVQAKILKDSFAWNAVTTTEETYIDSVGIRIDAFDIMEIISGG